MEFRVEQHARALKDRLGAMGFVTRNDIAETAEVGKLEARHGEEALRMATFAYPYLHLVITDVVMPELDGRALGQRLRDRFPSLPVLYISAYPTTCPSRRACQRRPIPPETGQ